MIDKITLTQFLTSYENHQMTCWGEAPPPYIIPVISKAKN